jgi:hypothetical protein
MYTYTVDDFRDTINVFLNWYKIKMMRSSIEFLVIIVKFYKINSGMACGHMALKHIYIILFKSVHRWVTSKQKY